MNNAAKGCLILIGSPIFLFFCCGFAGCLNPSKPEPDPKSPMKGILAKAPEEPVAKPARKSTSQQDKLDRFSEVVKAAGASGKVVTRLRVEDDDVTITVVNDWHRTPYQIRLQAAQNLYALWLHVADEPRLTSMSIVDLNGNEVGGTGFTGVWVQK